MRKIIITQFVVLLVGTVFAWVNFARELISWLNNRACDLGCPVAPLTNPFLTPCFYGALFFTIALALSLALLSKKLSPTTTN
jgi:hypothetical protein